jgi:hypothetical protein
MNSYADISHLLKSDSNKVPIEGAGMANSIKNQAWRQPDMNIFGRNGLSSENIHSTVPQQANEGPGAIGMERRQNRSSINSNGYASSSFLSGEASGLFSPDQHLSSPIISKGSLSTVTDSMVGIIMIKLLSF